MESRIRTMSANEVSKLRLTLENLSGISFYRQFTITFIRKALETRGLDTSGDRWEIMIRLQMHNITMRLYDTGDHREWLKKERVLADLKELYAAIKALRNERIRQFIFNQSGNEDAIPSSSEPIAPEPKSQPRRTPKSPGVRTCAHPRRPLEMKAVPKYTYIPPIRVTGYFNDSPALPAESEKPVRKSASSLARTIPGAYPASDSESESEDNSVEMPPKGIPIIEMQALYHWRITRLNLIASVHNPMYPYPVPAPLKGHAFIMVPGLASARAMLKGPLNSTLPIRCFWRKGGVCCFDFGKDIYRAVDAYHLLRLAGEEYGKKEVHLVGKRGLLLEFILP